MLVQRLQVWIQRKGAAMSYKANIFNRNVLKTCPTSKKLIHAWDFSPHRSIIACLFKYPSGANYWSISVSTTKIKLTTGPFHTNWKEISIGKWLSTMQRSRQVIIVLSSQLPKLIQTHLLSQSSNSAAFKTTKIMNYSNRIKKKKPLFFYFLKGQNLFLRF